MKFFLLFIIRLGSEDLGLNEDDLEEDFDPDKYDKRMKEIFQVCHKVYIEKVFMVLDLWFLTGVPRHTRVP